MGKVVRIEGSEFLLTSEDEEYPIPEVGWGVQVREGWYHLVKDEEGDFVGSEESERVFYDTAWAAGVLIPMAYSASFQRETWDLYELKRPMSKVPGISRCPLCGARGVRNFW